MAIVGGSHRAVCWSAPWPIASGFTTRFVIPVICYL